jgi:hypothetical protein
MSSQTPNANLWLSELARLIAPGILGFYTHFEVTEVVAFIEGQKKPVNVFTILVAEDRGNETSQPCTFLCPRIKLKSLKDWTLGIARYTRPIADLSSAFDQLSKNGEWQQSGAPLIFGKLVAVPRQFVPPDAAAPIPWNHVLKNNFWNGSHLFEWSDPEKTALRPLFEDSRRLQELSEEIQKHVPIGLAALSDRLGNLVLQLPVTILQSKFSQQRDSHNFQVQLAWHQKATPRPLRASCEWEFDHTVAGYMSLPVQAPETILPMQAGSGGHRGVIWDEAHQVILAATGPMHFINEVSLRMYVADSEPRTFSVKQKDGTSKPFRIEVGTPSTQNITGKSHGNDNGDWTLNRMYREQMSRLEKERRFVQYKPDTGRQDDVHEQALKDLRYLINQHGQKGAWLWDPYLMAHDLLETLFHCVHSGSDLRALTSGREVPLGKQGLCDRAWRWIVNQWQASSAKRDFVQSQREELDRAQSNWRGLRLEYRVRHGAAGWGFHDRFLIFPKTNRGALAWSLGTSVNSFGKEHHILQQVEDGQPVMDAFVELWDCLGRPEYLIWKKP